ITLAAPGPGAFGAPVGLDEGDYEFSFTAQYINHDSECTSGNMTKIAEEIASVDSAIKKIVDQLVGEAAKEGKEKAQKKPKNPVDKRSPPRDKQGKALERMFRVLDHFSPNIDVLVNSSADQISLQLPSQLAGFDSERFLLLGAAAAAIKKGEIILTDPSSECIADARDVLKAIKGKNNRGNPDGLELLRALSCDDVLPPTSTPKL
ncbi:MAG: hypothetical protein ABFS02_11700, partial [Pseudomonadota bacterium]